MISNAKRVKSYITPLSICALVILIIFGSYEIIERVFLSDVSANTIKILHMARGMSSSLIVAVIITIYFLKKGTLPSMSPNAGVADLSSALWLIKCRWLAFILTFIFVFGGNLYFSCGR